MLVYPFLRVKRDHGSVTDNDFVNTSLLAMTLTQSVTQCDTVCDTGTFTSDNNLGTGTVWKTTNDFQAENTM